MDATARFTELVGGPEPVLATALDEAALLIAAHAYPELDVAAYRSRLDDLAGTCPDATLPGVVHHLFTAAGFTGNEVEYYDARNSYLNEVIDRRLGIPITLSIVLIEVARRLGIAISGVGAPNRFLTRYDGDAAPLFIDAFGGGRIMDEQECSARFATDLAPGVEFDPAYLEPVGAREIVARMLMNLKSLQSERRKPRDLAWILRLRVAIPGVPLRERAELAQALVASGQFIDAADVLDEAASFGSARSSQRLRGRARQLRARLN